MILAIILTMNLSAGGGTQSSAAASGARELTICKPDIAGTATPVSFNDNLPVWNEVQKRLNLKINWEVLPPAQYNTSAQARLAAGINLPDIIQLPTTSVTDVMKYAQQGILIKLNDLINSNGPDIVNLFKKNPDLAAGMTDPDGNIYFFTNYLLDVPNGQGMVVRKDLLDKLGLQIPKTIDDWYKVLSTLKTTNLITPTSDIVPYGGNVRFFKSGFGIPVQQPENAYFYPDSNNKIIYDAMRDEFRDYLTFMNKLSTEGMLDPMYGTGATNINDLLTKGLVPTTAANPGDCDNYINQVKGAIGGDPLFVWTFTPVGPDGKGRWVPLPTARGDTYQGITRDCKNPALAMEFLNYVYANPEGTRLSLCGIEGIHYNIVNGKIQFTDNMINNPQYNIITQLRLIGAFHYLDIQNGEFNIARGVGQYKAGIDLIAANPDQYIAAIPALIPTESEQSAIMEYWPDIKTYIDEMTIRFIKGNEPLSNFNAFRNKLRDMGIDKLTALYQGMYERYQKSL